MSKPIKVIDLFSGPGGLGEGFSQVKSNNGTNAFKIVISIEKDSAAHKTLLLRSFYRQFGDNVPDEYYQFLNGNLGKAPEELLYNYKKFQNQYNAAQKEAFKLELGKNNQTINKKIKSALGTDECILIGGPPCQAYSLAGRARNKGIKGYNAEKDHRNFLYKEYLKVIAHFQPVAFVMENVKGMLSAKINGKSIYETIFQDLHDPCKAVKITPKRGFSKHSYSIYSFVTNVTDKEPVDPKDFIIKSEDYGVPQRRHRVILVGFRDDINVNSKDLLLKPSSIKIPLKTVISDLPKLRSGLSKSENTSKNWLNVIKNDSVNTLQSLYEHGYHKVAEEYSLNISKMTAPNLDQGMNFGVKRSKSIKNNILSDWYYDKKMGNIVTNHETRGHIESDLQRYLFCSSWAKIASRESWTKKLPKSSDYPDELLPRHANFKSGKFADRFRTQLFNIPATTITSHISKDGHYYIHPDPTQCRSLTVREAARIQTFPDNYFFCGNRTQQYVQVGNAVPPYLSYKLAKILYNCLCKN
ncbi:DNA cytosine methyltransferase [Pleionea mediterranea]|uniref:DNA (cytosine-5-)-methyltransferase n=1 Tax=Pleionea mediterranea TaxID=523701 RepID=A0A316FG79_9GAMM|nr:DNA cytosine methyltransferase [Pleionea mediterranea]PWK47908.1 DNA (cytosine-5)-methyltransferase 1 [Pleionea mediterranea]